MARSHLPDSEEFHYPPWPGRLQQRLALQLHRGEVIVFNGTCHAIVGFDGRNEAYLCWELLQDAFDTNKIVLVPLSRAHIAERPARSLFPEVPVLPEIDHTGKLPRRRKVSAMSEEATKQQDLHQLDAAVEASESCLNVENYPSISKLELVAEDRDAQIDSSAKNISSELLPDSPRDMDVHEIESVYETSFENFVHRNAPTSSQAYRFNEEPWKKCSITTLLHSLTLNFGVFCGWLRTIPQNGQMCLQRVDASSIFDKISIKDDGARVAYDSDGIFVCEPFDTSIDSAHEESTVKPKRHDAFEDIRITIPIVKPPSWREVQHIAHRMPVTFDERGVKESMTVKMNRWETFVDRQKDKLEKEIQDLLEIKAREQKESDCEDVVDEPEREQEPLDDDIIELQRMSQRMNDWKDLTRYSGKSISMASTRRGNDMKIHVMAFAEREDGSGVDFMRLSYKKSVVVRENGREIQAPSGMRSTLRLLLPFLSSGSYDDDSLQRWIELLQQPDIAKFTIALAFRGALENDGVHLEFCEARLDDLA